jgi:uncharacterized RDD family membrane protein YckC
MPTLAHPGKRFQGQFIDGLISLLLFGACISIQLAFAFNGRVMDSIIVIIPCAYFLFADALGNGQSIAKRWLKIRVIHQTTHQPCNLWQSLLRNGISPIFGVLDAMLIFTQERKRVGDYLAKTVVINDEPITTH